MKELDIDSVPELNERIDEAIDYCNKKVKEARIGGDGKTAKKYSDFRAILKKYKKYCEDFGYLTKNGRPRLTAEILYRYITGDELFNEAHTALQDVYCELIILLAEFAFHKKMIKTYYNPKAA